MRALERQLALASAAVRSKLSESGQIKPPINLREVSAAFGVHQINLADISADAMLQASKQGYRVILKRGVIRQRTRFSWAHELGHLLLDRPKSGAAAFRGVEQRKIEQLCDQIAAEILMPATMFAIYAQGLGYGLSAIPRLATLFEASRQAVARRLLSTHPEHCVLTIWSLHKQTRLPTIQTILSNQKRGIQHGRPAWRTNSPGQYFQCVFDAFEHSRSIRSLEPTIINERYGRKYMSRVAMIPTEAWAYGSGHYRAVFTLGYVDREDAPDSV